MGTLYVFSSKETSQYKTCFLVKKYKHTKTGYFTKRVHLLLEWLCLGSDLQHTADWCTVCRDGMADACMRLGDGATCLSSHCIPILSVTNYYFVSLSICVSLCL